ncbi:MAG: 50S ribosomal protein L32 [Patescibacteria group bacterium]
MALPIKHHNKHSKGNRRSHHALKKVNLTKCGKCEAPIMPHFMCKACGNYNGRTVINTGARAEKALKKKANTVKK